MARISATSNRSAKNVRNGPSVWQQRLSTILSEARWLVFLVLAAWLTLVLYTWNSSDPAWSYSLEAGTIHNQGGKIGAYVADILLYLFGYFVPFWQQYLRCLPKYHTQISSRLQFLQLMPPNLRQF